ncbi:pentapeptide repeat-containing protein [Trinickia mobilis]|uniref:pentapeptide repeat-containing protein n=1 Tax=Trinickia mobilis TaxID=2816356 RepID=UPI0035ABDFBB
MPKGLEGCKFLRCKFDGSSDFKNCCLNDAIFEECQLDDVDFSSAAGMKRISFDRCELRQVNFERKKLYDVKISNSSVLNCNFSRAALHDAELREVNFSGSDFSGSIWSCTHFYKCNLASCQTVRTRSTMISAVELCTNVPENVRKKACSNIDIARAAAKLYQTVC